MRKTLLVVAGATAVVVGGGAAAANHYDQYKNKQHKEQVTAVAQAKAAQAKADAVKEQLLVKANQTLATECQKGLTAYAKLPFSVQRVVPKPVCTSPTAQ